MPNTTDLPAPDANVRDIVAWVKQQPDQPTAAQDAYNQELAADKPPRATLLDQLRELGATTSTPAGGDPPDLGAQSPATRGRTLAYPNGLLPGDEARTTPTVTTTSTGTPGNEPDEDFDPYANWNEETHGPTPTGRHHTR